MCWNRSVFCVCPGYINPYMPRTFGEATCHITHFDTMVEGELPLPQLPPRQLTDEHATIGKLIATKLVENGATIQMGKYREETDE